MQDFFCNLTLISYLAYIWNWNDFSCCFSCANAPHSPVLCFHRFWYGGYSASGGRVFSHSRGRHLLPSSCCRLQWICHLRYYHICTKRKNLSIIWKQKTWGFWLKLESFENTQMHRMLQLRPPLWIMKDLFKKLNAVLLFLWVWCSIHALPATSLPLHSPFSWKIYRLLSWQKKS